MSLVPGGSLAAPSAREIPWVALDLEMTGLDPVRDRICEVGVVAGPCGQPGDAWGSLLDPGVSMETPAQAVHGLGEADVAGQPRFEDLADALHRRLDGAWVVGHRVDVDRAFLDAAFRRAGRAPPSARWVDTLEVARRVLVLPRHRLGDVCTSLGVPVDGRHRAAADARATHAVWSAMIELVDPTRAVDVDALLARIDELAPRSAWRRGLRRRMREALRARRVVRLRYMSRGAAGRVYASEREVELWKVAPPCVEGFCHLRGEGRIFRVDRVLDLDVLTRTYSLPDPPMARL